MLIGAALNDFGVFLGLLGALLIFLYGLAPAIERDGGILLSTGESVSEKHKAQTFMFRARAGAIFLIAGFLFQLVGNHTHSTRTVREWVWWISLLAAVLSLYAITWSINRWMRSRVTFVAQYFPQYQEGTNSHEHLWMFQINNGMARRTDMKLYLPQEARQVDVMQQGRKIRSVSNAHTIEFKNVGPSRQVTVRAWNLPAIETIIADSYLEAGGKTVRPRLVDSIYR